PRTRASSPMVSNRSDTLTSSVLEGVDSQPWRPTPGQRRAGPLPAFEPPSRATARDGDPGPQARGSRGVHAMAAKRAIVTAIVRQSRPPRGGVGNVAGGVMAHRPSNRQRNCWVASLLEVRPTDRVLEIGFGPGLAIAELSRRIGPAGHVDGL